jgi:LacI family transcriptional regulator
MTVSRVIHNRATVREETRDAVLAAIRELNYEPNLAARNLVMAGELRIGVIYSNPSAAFMSDFVMLRAANLPVAVVAAGRPPADAISVRIDDRQASQAMTQHLLGLGHRRIGFIAGNPDQTASAERLEGARAAIAAVAGAELVLAQGAFTYGSGLRAAEGLLASDAPPTAIFASNDDMAAAVVSVAHRRHLDVPSDLTVVGFDDTTVATTLWPPLTTIRQPVRQMAAVALDRLIRALRSADPLAEPYADQVLDHALIERQSTAPPRRAKTDERSSHA